MLTSESIKQVVKDKYGEIAQAAETTGCGCDRRTANAAVFSNDYSRVQGYVVDADLGLGCGLPTEFAHIKEGDTVVDLGSGAGNDCFVARAEVGEAGEVIGVDMTEPMVAKARKNAEKLGYENVHFRLGEIEDLPVTDNRADVVVSNCVLNLVPDKKKAFEETFRILKPGGHFSISDVVTGGELPEKLKQAAAVYTGCVAGALPKHEYLALIEAAGFVNVVVQQERKIDLPEQFLAKYLSPQEISEFRELNPGIHSITVYAEKPGQRRQD
ncbi:MAG: arsenite methyltransferase [bacterium]